MSALLIVIVAGWFVACFLLVWGLCVAAGNADRLAEQCRADVEARADERRAASELRVQNNVTAFPMLRTAEATMVPTHGAQTEARAVDSSPPASSPGAPKAEPPSARPHSDDDPGGSVHAPPSARRVALSDRFWSKVDKSGDIDGRPDCWLWTAATKRGLYGKFAVGDGVYVGAHRVAYMLAVGPIPEGFEIDHLCRVTLCVNPAHLEAVTPTENRRRSNERRPRPRRPVRRRTIAKRDPSTPPPQPSRFRGVSWHTGKWRAAVWFEGRKVHLGRFIDEIEAATAVELFRRNRTPEVPMDFEFFWLSDEPTVVPRPSGESQCPRCGGEEVVAIGGPDRFGNYETTDCHCASNERQR